MFYLFFQLKLKSFYTVPHRNKVLLLLKTFIDIVEWNNFLRHHVFLSLVVCLLRLLLFVCFSIISYCFLSLGVNCSYLTLSCGSYFCIVFRVVFAFTGIEIMICLNNVHSLWWWRNKSFFSNFEHFALRACEVIYKFFFDLCREYSRLFFLDMVYVLTLPILLLIVTYRRYISWMFLEI